MDPPLFAHEPLRAAGLYGLRGESTFWIPPLSFHFSKGLHPIRVIHFWITHIRLASAVGLERQRASKGSASLRAVRLLRAVSL